MKPKAAAELAGVTPAVCPAAPAAAPVIIPDAVVGIFKMTFFLIIYFTYSRLMLRL